MSESDRTSEQTLRSSSSNRGPDTTGLYTLLCVERNATPSELKRAYRRLALVHHPDRNRTPRERSDTNDSGATFVRIQYAYDVLSDARKRRIYDRYGEMGVQMAGRVGGALLDPQVTSVLSSFAVGSAMVALLIVAFFALLARRVDHTWSIPFALVFTPLWLVDAVVVAGIVWFYAKGHALFGGHGDEQPDAERANEYGDEDSVVDSDEDSVVDSDDSGDRDDAPCDEARPSSSSYGATATTNPISGPTSGSDADGPSSADHAASSPATSKTPLLAATNNGDSSSGRANSSARRYNSRLKRRRLRQVRSHVEALFRCIATPAPAVYLALLFAFQILIVLRLDHHVSWSVWLIVSPWLGIEAVHFILLTLHFIESVCLAAEQAVRARAAADNSSNTEDRSDPPAVPLKHIVVMAADTYWWLAIRVSLALLISSKIDPLGMAHAWSWALVFGPSYLPFVRWTLMLCVLRRRLRAMGEAETAQNERAIFGAYVFVVALTCAFLYSFVALLVWKLSLPQAVRMALVLVPVFIVMTLCCCLCSCISLCLSYGISATLDEEQRVEAGDASAADGSNARASPSLSSAENNGTSGMLVPANRRIE